MLSLKNQKLCSFYLANACKKGNSCPFSHEQPPPPRLVCKYYSSGSCKFGEQCRNVHEKPGIRVALGEQELPCVFWKVGKCSKGDQCKFLHEPLALPSNSNSWREQQTNRSSPPASGRKLGSRPIDVVAVISGKEKVSNQPEVCHNLGEKSRLSAFQAPPRHDIQGHASISADSSPVDGKKQSGLVASFEATIERSFLARTRATFESGGAIRAVQTAFESRRVTLSNLPDETNSKEIISVAEGFGPLESVVLTPSALGMAGKAELEYLDPDCAKAAAVALDGKELRTRRLTAQLNLRSADMDAADLRSSTLKMSWFAPSRVAYAHYDTIHDASRKASQLDGRSFAARKLSAVFQQPSPRQRRSFTVIVKGLPLHIQVDDLKNFCSTQSVDIGKANYHGKGGTGHVRKLLETFGPLESFDLSHPMPKDIKVKALVRFAKPEHAAAAAEKLQGQSQTFLGGVKTWVTLLHSIKYNIPQVQFRVLKEELRRLQATGEQKAKVRVYDTDETGRAVDPVCIRVYGDDPKMLGGLKTEIEGLLLGEEVIHNGKGLWDRFFSGNGSGQFVEGVQDESGAFVRRDFRRRKLRVSGSRQQKDRAGELLLRKVQELGDQRQHLPLTKLDLSRLLQGEFARLQGILGDERLSLDIRNRILVVHGDEEEIQVACLSLRAPEANVALPAAQNLADCPVCFCEVTKPVKLICGHSICFPCLLRYLSSAENFPVKCLGDDGRCDRPIPLSTIKHILPSEDEARFFETAFLAYVHQRPNEFHYCPTPDCPMIYRPAEPGVVLRCFECLARICPSCHVEFHEGLTCGEHRENQTGGEALQRWKEAHNIQACPGCTADTEKRDGCNHITCIRCRTHWCWVCRAMFPDGKVIYEHMRVSHGGIYDQGGVYDGGVF